MSETTDETTAPDPPDESTAESAPETSGEAPRKSSPRQERRPAAKAGKTAKTAKTAKASKAAKAQKAPRKAAAPRAASAPDDDRQHPGDGQHDERQHDERQHDDEPSRRPRPKGTRLAVIAAEQLVGLTGKDFEGIVGLSRDGDGWCVSVEVLEMRRIPSTTDVIAVYEVDVDEDGDLTGYRRVRRFLRGEAGEDR